jgi:perosamine synthetase
VRVAHVPNASLTIREIAKAAVLPLSVEVAERQIEERMPGHHAVLFRSCRGALASATAVLGASSKVAVSGYTCVAVPNAIVSGGATPVFVDVDANGLVPQMAWPNTGLVVVQDTYGLRSGIPLEREVIRDAALCSDGYECEPGVRVVVASFEHSKALSAGQGGLAVTREPDLARELRQWRNRWPPAARGIPHLAVTALSLWAGRRSYRGSRLGTVGQALFAKLAPSRATGNSPIELSGRGVDERLLGAPSRTAARLIVGQLGRKEALARHRQQVVSVYDTACEINRAPLPLSRYPMLCEDPDAFAERMAVAGWGIRSRWFEAPIHPSATHPHDFGYYPERDSNAHALANHIVNLPTHPLVSIADARQLIRLALQASAAPLRPPEDLSIDRTAGASWKITAP